MFLIITLFGYIGTKVISSPITSIFKNLLNKSSLIKNYLFVCKRFNEYICRTKKGFSEPVLVKVYENSTIERIGFITNEDVESLNIKKGKVLVYIHIHMLISGQLFVVEKKYVTRIDKPASEVMAHNFWRCN